MLILTLLPVLMPIPKKPKDVMRLLSNQEQKGATYTAPWLY
jgi:hypothetical protein